MKMKRISSLLICIFVMLLCFAPICLADDNEDAQQYFANNSGYETRHFDVTVDIDENNVYQVTEKIVVDFQTSKHGIFRYIPVTSKIYRDLDGNAVAFPTRASISNVKVEGYEVDTSYEDNNMVLKIGDPDRYLTGVQEYVISYRYRPHDDRMSDYDEVYFNLLPTRWDSPIDTASFTVNMPEQFDVKKLSMYAGQEGSQNNDNIKYTVEGNTIKAQIINKIPMYYGVTMRLELPEGYFKSQKTDDFLIALMWALIIAPPILLLLFWFFYGRDPVLVKPIAVMPPDGMTSADVGYLVDDVVENRDVLSLLFYWADKGCLQISEADKGDFVLTRLKPLPDNSKSYEHTMFDRLFRSGETVLTSDLSGKFYETLNTAKAQVKGEYNYRESTRLYTKASMTCKTIAPLLAIIPILAAGIIASYVNVVGIGGIILTVIEAFFLIVSYGLVISCATSWNSMTKSKRTGIMVGATAFILLIMFLFYVQAKGLFTVTNEMPKQFADAYLNPMLPILVAMIGSLVGLFCSVFMRKRTPLMNTWFGEILGLKEFITLAEKERLEMMIHENPSYFYNILPYAYVLGVSDTWAKKFEHIAIPAPQWYGSSNPYTTFNTLIFMSAINRNMNNVQQNLSVPPINTGSGGGFSGGGGGFSGGGFSGGGGGGGGGGSW